MKAQLLGGLLLAASTLLLLLRRRRALATSKTWSLIPVSLSTVMRLIREQRVQELIYSDGGQLLLRMKDCVPGAPAHLVSQLVAGSEAAVFALAEKVPMIRYMPPGKGVWQALPALSAIVFFAIWYQALRSLISRNESYVSSRTNRKPSTSFADVVSRSKVELEEIVDYLNRPQRYREAGARMPRGALLVGPSGTGKTLLARAVAGEAKCSFLSATPSEFVEVYVGRGAARVRDLFRQARDLAPCVLFLDELDALGSRGKVNSGSEEHIQTLNQLLTELDGFHGQRDGVVILAATNRHEALDPALLRPGRFDRHIFVELPDEAERLAILRLHSRKASLAAGTEDEVLRHVVSITAGSSGAELANIINEAVFLALRSGRSRVERQDLETALHRCNSLKQRDDARVQAPNKGFLSFRALTAH